MLDVTQQPVNWYQNRKFVVPLLTSVIAVLLSYLPNFPFSPEEIVGVVMLIIGFVAGGDVIRDNVAMLGLTRRELAAKG